MSVRRLHGPSAYQIRRDERTGGVIHEGDEVVQQPGHMPVDTPARAAYR